MIRREGRRSLRRRPALLVLSAVAALATVGVALSQSGGGFDLSWHAITGGGGTSTGGNLALQGAIGQPVTGRSTGGQYALESGFLGGGTIKFNRVAPGMARDGTID